MRSERGKPRCYAYPSVCPSAHFISKTVWWICIKFSVESLYQTCVKNITFVIGFISSYTSVRQEIDLSFCSSHILYQWSRTLLKKLIAAGQEIPRLVRKPTVRFRVHRSPSLHLVVSQMNPVHSLSPRFLKIQFNVLPFALRSSKWSLPFNFLSQIFVHFPSPPYVLHAPTISYFFILSPW
jgi:hypothetical protein